MTTPSRRIALVTNRFHPEVGGAETNIYFQAKELSRKHRVTVFCPKRIDQPSKETIDGFQVRRCFNLFNWRRRYPYLAARTLCPRFALQILFGRYDIVQCFPALNLNNLLVFLACKLRGIPILLCSFDYLDYAGILAEQGRVPPDLLEKHRPKPWTRFVLSRVDHIFAIAHKELALFKRLNSNVSYSPVPVRLEEYEGIGDLPKNALGVPSGAFVFLCLGRVSRVKGQDLAVEAFAKVANEAKDAHLVIVGRQDYEPEFVEGLRKAARRRGLEQRIHFAGEVERTEALAWLKRADVHVIPVRFMNAGAVVVESWVSGTPVVQSDAVDPNLVTEAENGYLFASESIPGLVAAMRKAYRNRGRLRELGERDRKLVLENFTYPRLIALYETVYERVCVSGQKR